MSVQARCSFSVFGEGPGRGKIAHPSVVREHLKNVWFQEAQDAFLVQVPVVSCRFTLDLLCVM